MVGEPKEHRKEDLPTEGEMPETGSKFVPEAAAPEAVENLDHYESEKAKIEARREERLAQVNAERDKVFGNDSAEQITFFKAGHNRNLEKNPLNQEEKLAWALFRKRREIRDDANRQIEELDKRKLDGAAERLGAI